MPHSINQGDARFAYFNKIWGIPMSMHDCGYWSAVAVGAAITVSSTSVSFGQASNTAGGMSDITVLSVDIGHFDYGHKIIHVYENSRNQSEYRNSPERWQFVIEPLLSTRPAANGNVEFRSFALDPVIEVIGKREQIRPKHRVMVPIDLINDWAREQALNVALAAYPDAKCKIGRSNVDVLPLTELTLTSNDIEAKDGLMHRRVDIRAKTQSFR